MKRQVIAAAVLGVAWLAVVPEAAFGHGGRFRRGCDGRTSACAGPCGTSYAAGCATVSYVDKEVTVYESRPVQKTVDVTVMKMVPQVQKYEYIERTPVMSKEKRTVTEYVMVTTPQPYTYYVQEVVPTKEKKAVTEYVMQPKEIEIDVTTYQAETTMVKRQVQKWVCQPKQVTVQVPVCRAVVTPAAPVTPAVATADCGGCGATTGGGHVHHAGGRGLFGRHANDCCAPAAASCGTVSYVTEMQTVTRTVMERVCVTEEISCPVTTCKPVVTKQKRVINQCIPVTKEVEVTVNKCVTKQMTGTRNVNECKPVTKEIMVDVCTYKEEKKTGERTIQVCQPTVEKVNTTTYECVPVKKMVKVAVYTPAPQPAPQPAPAPIAAAAPCCAPAPAATCCDSGHHRGGFHAHRTSRHSHAGCGSCCN